MDAILLIESILYFLLGLCFLLYEIAKDTFKWTLGVLHGFLQLFIMLGILMTFKFLDKCYELLLSWHNGRVRKTERIASKEDLEKSSALSARSSNAYSVSKSDASRSSTSTFPTSAYSGQSSNTDRESEESNAQWVFLRRFNTVSPSASGTTYSENNSSGQTAVVDRSTLSTRSSARSSSTFPTTTDSSRSSNTNRGRDENNVDAFFLRRFNIVSSAGSATTSSKSTYSGTLSSGQSSSAEEDSD